VPYYESGKYDFALLHIDQQCIDERIAFGKTNVFKDLRSVIKDIPIIVINHGTPVYPEVFNQMVEKDEGVMPSRKNGVDWAVGKMEKILEGVDKVVVNSHEAAEMWGFGHVIIHGIDADEWWDLPKEPRVVTMISPAGMGEEYYGRQFFKKTREELKKKYGIQSVWVGEGGDFAPSWDRLRDYLGRSLIYFNPTLGSPMPRSRTEAMYGGSCVITTPHQGADKFIEDGVNGFLCKVNPKSASKLIAELFFDYDRAVRIGQEGRKTALKLFGGDRFRSDWLDLVEEVLDRDLSHLRGLKNKS